MQYGFRAANFQTHQEVRMSAVMQSIRPGKLGWSITEALKNAKGDQLTNLRNWTLMANPIAMKVAINEANPALIKGNGTPITGKSPSSIPMLMKI